MRTIQLDWQQATALSVGLVLLYSLTSRSSHRSLSRAAAYFAESAIVAALYSVWQLAGTVSLAHGQSPAFARGRWILRFEHRIGLPSELDLQRLINGHRLVEQLCNLYYASMHFLLLGVLLVWLFARHRESYRPIRNVLVLLTLSCLLIQLYPVAPPRLLPDEGFTDTAAKLGQSVYHPFAGITVDQLSAMPSVHVGWAVLVGWTVLRVSRSRWRWLALAHPVLTVFVVTATANHYWLDAIVAVVLLVAAVAVTRLAESERHGRAGADAPTLSPEYPIAVSSVTDESR